MKGMLAAGAIALGAAAVRAEPAAPVVRPPAPSCFNFRNVTDYAITRPARIRVTTGAGARFDLDLAGAGCLSGTKTLAIASAPVVDLCAGPQTIERLIRFRREGLEPVSCRIAMITSAAAQ
jgi:hypothetical protein